MRRTPNLKRKREKNTKVFVSLVYLVIYHLCLLMSIGFLVTCGWAESLRWQVKTRGLFSVSATYSLPSFCFTLNFEVVSVSKWRRVFLLFFPKNLSGITAFLKACHTFWCGSFLGAFWCSPGDSSKLWLCPWKLQLDYPVPLWESILRLWILVAYHTSPGNSKFSFNNSAFWLFNPNSEYIQSIISCF